MPKNKAPKGPSPRQLKKLYKTNAPLSEEASGKRLKKNGTIKKGYSSSSKLAEGASRVPYTTVKKAPVQKAMQMTFGGTSKSGTGTTKYAKGKKPSL